MEYSHFTVTANSIYAHMLLGDRRRARKALDALVEKGFDENMLLWPVSRLEGE